MANDNIGVILKRMAKKAGTNLTEVCRRAEIPRQTIERWKNKEPKTIKLLKKLEETITIIKRENGR